MIPKEVLSIRYYDLTALGGLERRSRVSDNHVQGRNDRNGAEERKRLQPAAARE